MKNPESTKGFVGKTTEPDSEFEELDKNESNQTIKNTNAVCYYDGSSYSPGTIICINGKDAKCKSTGKWTFLGTSDQC